MTQGELFHKFVRNIKPTENENQRARKHRDYAKRMLDRRDLGIIGSRNYGSYAKNTAIRPLNDIDYVIYIDPDEYPHDNMDRILHRIASSLRSSYPQNNVEAGMRSIKITYSDGFSVDLVPALTNNKNPPYEPARILDRNTGDWIDTSPSKHVEFTKLINDVWGSYRLFVQMFKVWKNQRRRSFRSFFLALLIADAVENAHLPGGWGETIYTIFKHVSDHGLDNPIFFTQFHPKPSQMPDEAVVVLDPVNPLNNVASDFDRDKKKEFLNSWRADMKKVENAVNTTNRADAVYYWKQIFGDQFPSNPY